MVPMAPTRRWNTASSQSILFTVLNGFPLIDTLAGRPDFSSRFAASMKFDGDAGVLLVTDALPDANDYLFTQPFADALALGLVDDLIFAATAIKGGNPGFFARRVMNCGQSLATMGRLPTLFPGVIPTAADTTTLAGTITNQTITVFIPYVISATSTGQNIELGHGFGTQQFDLTNEGFSGSINTNINILSNGVLLANITRAAGAAPFYFTAKAMPNGYNWSVSLIN